MSPPPPLRNVVEIAAAMLLLLLVAVAPAGGCGWCTTCYNQQRCSVDVQEYLQRLSAKNILAMLTFEHFDRNRDRRVSLRELRSRLPSSAYECAIKNLVISLGGNDGQINCHEFKNARFWTTSQQRLLACRWRERRSQVRNVLQNTSLQISNGK
ncbi:PREDICTED: uncharacterized protein LOC106806882 [Priapulus caudatus]|uniref:Uncharacterized protein LOC106806882 n=1 Tax=Priapulus caudatus TaxID=37621 RepID=A0ABM1DX35_PRICU|nr:PREDICTED: uncharacterized protein LOC106806882 [Priapulus caudatus]